MRVGIDATPLILSSGGLPRYTAELSLALARTFASDEYILISNQTFPNLPSNLPNLHCRSGAGQGRRRLWWLWGIERELSRQRVDLFHGTNFEVPLLPRRPAVLTLHDLSPWMDPAWHGNAHRVRRRTPPLIGLGLATMLITPTEAMRRQAMDFFHIHPSRVVAVPHGGLPCTAPPVRPKTSHRFFLYAGTLEPRKNIPAVIAAWRPVWRTQGVGLTLAGRHRADFAPLQEEEGLTILGEVSEERLIELYSEALALVYFSHYEGFGLPVVEAMQCGTCVVISPDPALVEVAGDAAIQARTSEELSQLMLALATNSELVLKLGEKARKRGAEFSWERTARLTRQVYVEAARRFQEM